MPGSRSLLVRSQKDSAQYDRLKVQNLKVVNALNTDNVISDQIFVFENFYLYDATLNVNSNTITVNKENILATVWSDRPYKIKINLSDDNAVELLRASFDESLGNYNYKNNNPNMVVMINNSVVILTLKDYSVIGDEVTFFYENNFSSQITDNYTGKISMFIDNIPIENLTDTILFRMASTIDSLERYNLLLLFIEVIKLNEDYRKNLIRLKIITIQLLNSSSTPQPELAQFLFILNNLIVTPTPENTTTPPSENTTTPPPKNTRIENFSKFIKFNREYNNIYIVRKSGGTYTHFFGLNENEYMFRILYSEPKNDVNSIRLYFGTEHLADSIIIEQDDPFDIENISKKLIVKDDVNLNFNNYNFRIENYSLHITNLNLSGYNITEIEFTYNSKSTRYENNQLYITIDKALYLTCEDRKLRLVPQAIVGIKINNQPIIIRDIDFYPAFGGFDYVNSTLLIYHSKIDVPEINKITIQTNGDLIYNPENN